MRGREPIRLELTVSALTEDVPAVLRRGVSSVGEDSSLTGSRGRSSGGLALAELREVGSDIT